MEMCTFFELVSLKIREIYVLAFIGHKNRNVTIKKTELPDYTYAPAHEGGGPIGLEPLPFTLEFGVRFPVTAV